MHQRSILAFAALVLMTAGAVPVAAGGQPAEATAVTAASLTTTSTAAAPGATVTVRARQSTGKQPDPVRAPVAIDEPSGRSTAAATADIQVTYTGFGADARGQAAQASFEAAVTVWESLVVSNRPIRLNANWTNLGSGGVLGSAGPTTFQKLSDNRWYPAALADALCSCHSNDPTAFDIDARFNSAFQQWYLGTDGATPLNRWDFYTVVLHEIGHGLGFVSSFRVSGTAGYWGFVFNQTRYPTRFDTREWSAQSTGRQLITYKNGSNALKPELTDGSVYFDGPEVSSLFGTRLPLYAPGPWEPGSSNSHFDEDHFPTGTPNALMTPFISNGEVIHDPGAATLAVFRDIGWTTADPNPTAPAAPTNVSAVAGNASASVTWSAPASNGGSPITSYTVSSAPDGVTCVTSGLSCIVSPLTNDRAYAFTVVATNAVGSGPSSAPSNAVTPSATADVDAPAVGIPSVVVAAPEALTTTALVELSWPESSDASGIALYELQRRKGTGSWVGVALGTPTATSAQVGITPGKAYAFRVRATDGASNTGDWATTAGRRLALVQETSAAVTYSGGWTRSSLSGASGGYVRKASTADRWAELSFHGTSAGFVSSFGPARGIAEILVDGTLVATVDLYAASAASRRVVWATADPLTPGAHTLRVVVTGTRNASATKNRIDVDAFLVWP